LNRAVGALLADPARLCAVASRSSHHALDFDRVELWRNPATDVVLRLHLWFDGEAISQRNAQDIHNHGRPLAIRVVCGSYRNEVWDLATAGTRYAHYEYRIDDVSLQTAVRKLGAALLARRSSVGIVAGQSYFLAPETLHRVLPSAQAVTASLVLQGPLARKVSDVYTTRGLPSLSAPLGAFDVYELRAKLNRLQDALPAA